jgi:hypothetical protein
MWGSPTTLAGAEPGVYGAAYIDGLITRPIAAQTVAIRQTNEALRLYAGYEDTATSKPTAPVVPSSGYVPTALWIPGREDTPVRWKAYVDGSTKEADLSAGPFGVLLWDGGTEIPPYSNKTAILEVETITIAADGSATVGDLLARYIIDYSGVEFDITASYRLANSDSGISVIGNSTNLNAAAAQSTDANGKPVITVTLTNKTGQTFTGKDDFNSGGATNGLWGGKVSGAPNSWKYADISVNVGKLFADLSGKILSVKSTNHAFRYYKGAPNIWAAAPDKPTIGDPNIYIPTSDTELPIKWKIYVADRFDISTTWGIILSEQAPEKVVTIEIREHSSIPTGEPDNTGTSTSNADDLAADAGTLLKTFKINYSDVTIN